MKHRSKRSLIFKSMVLLSITRWYNIALTALAQYIAAFFIFNKWFDRYEILTDIKLHLIVLCTSIFIAAGYVINFFYDKEVDLINYPRRTKMYLIISKEFLLRFYFSLIVVGLLIAFLASFKIGIFFFAFSFLLWFYSHKLKRIPYVRELSATLLTVASFFSITLHYGEITPSMFLYGWFVFFIILIREGVKDREQSKGNAVFSYYSVSLVNNAEGFLNLLKLLSAIALLPILLFAYINGLQHYGLWVLILIWIILNVSVYLLHQKLSTKYAGVANSLLKICIVLSLIGLVWL